MVLVIYVREGCPYCKKVKDEIKKMNKEKEVEIYYADKDFDTKDFKEKYGQDATFPRGYMKKEDQIELVGGSDDIIKKLKEM